MILRNQSNQEKVSSTKIEIELINRETKTINGYLDACSKVAFTVHCIGSMFITLDVLKILTKRSRHLTRSPIR